MSPIPWSWIWFFCAVLAFVIGFATRDDIRRFIDGSRSSRVKKKDEDPLPPKPSPQTDAGGTCVFENEDLVLKQVYDYSGKRVSQGTTVNCSDCSQYVFKDEDGCVPYGYDFTENRSKSGGVCTVGGYKKQACSSDKDCTNGKGCGPDKFCNDPPWVIPDSKVCPF
jgi:hypothetical protein